MRKNINNGWGDNILYVIYLFAGKGLEEQKKHPICIFGLINYVAVEQKMI